MRNLAAALLILSLTTSCTRSPQHDTRSVNGPTPPLVGQSTSTAAPALAVSTSSAATVASSTTTVPTRAIATTAEPGTDSASAESASVVEAMIGGSVPPDLPDGALWIGVVAGGHVIQTTTLSETADRATVAISLAFENRADRAAIEPVGLRVELLRTEPAGWHVLAIGYL
jgi:hypothetical protein